MLVFAMFLLYLAKQHYYLQCKTSNNNKTEVIVRNDEYEYQQHPRLALIAHLKSPLKQLSSQFSTQDDLIIEIRNKIEDLKEERDEAKTAHARRKRKIKELTPSFEYRSKEAIKKGACQG
jgi:peptidoglycan hydrolase CwlO-like protein